MRIVTKDVNEGAHQAAVVMPVADAEDDIAQRCLDNLGKTTRVPLRVFLVESSGSEFAYGRSVNAGIAAAEGFDIIIGMDSDAFPREGAIERLLEFMRAHPQVGFSGARIVSPGTDPNIGWVLQSMGWFVVNALKARAPLFALRRILKGKWWSFSIRAPKDYIPGKMVGAITTTFVLRRQCYEDVGPFDERFRVSFVDVDYNFRMLISDKWHISSCPSAEVFHEGHTTRIARRENMEFEGWDVFLRKWTKDKIGDVKAAAGKGKFIIPDERWR
jgi:GT2 family glycosyltransferase